MDSSSFDLANASHWLLVSVFIVVSATGLVVSRQWSQEAKSKRQRLRLSRRLMMEVHNKTFPLRDADSRQHYGNSPTATDRATRFNHSNSPNPIRFDD